MVADGDAPTLPSPGSERWTPRRKAAVIEGVRQGLLTIEEACERYNLTIDEYRAWGARLRLARRSRLAGDPRRHLSQATARAVTLTMGGPNFPAAFPKIGPPGVPIIERCRPEMPATVSEDFP